MGKVTRGWANTSVKSLINYFIRPVRTKFIDIIITSKPLYHRVVNSSKKKLNIFPVLTVCGMKLLIPRC